MPKTKHKGMSIDDYPLKMEFEKFVKTPKIKPRKSILNVVRRAK